ncbi:MAG: ThiF family adenylyltransferase [bacterium]|nr:ThiF family adenylyltransferase [bacterium]
MKSKLSNKEIWQKIVNQDWDLKKIRRRLQHPRTFYTGRPQLFTAEEVFSKNILVKKGRSYILNINQSTQKISAAQIVSVVASTHQQLKKIFTHNSRDPVCQYLVKEFLSYQYTADKKNFGFYAFYFDAQNNFVKAVQFPNLPTYKLSLVASGSALYRDQNYQKGWYEIRRIFNRTHVLVAGASVASVTAHMILRDARIGYLTIGDPKSPNATNFNRTAYDVFDVANDESKAIAFARQVHAQDPTQIIYLEPAGFSIKNFQKYISANKNYPAVDLVIEAIDNIFHKIDLLKIAQKNSLPIIQLADVGSIAEINFNNPNDLQTGKNLFLGISNKKLEVLLKKDFLTAAIYLVGLENAFSDEAGLFLKNKSDSPFKNTTPQMGSTTLVAAGMATEKALRYLIDKKEKRNFNCKRLLFDKKNDQLKIQEWTNLKAMFLSFSLDLRKFFLAKTSK